MNREERARLWRTRKEALGKVTAEVASEYGLDAATLFASRSRLPPASDARREVMSRMCALGLSASEVGRLVGRDHSTVLAALQRAKGEAVQCHECQGTGEVHQ